MNTNELKRNLEYLVNKYVDEVHEKSGLLQQIHCDGYPPVKGIMAALTEPGKKIDPGDSDLIKDIAFQFM